MEGNALLSTCFSSFLTGLSSFGPHYAFEIGSLDRFEAQLDRTQDDLQIPPAERIPVQYKTASDFGQTFLYLLPTMILIAAPFIMGRMMMGGGMGRRGGLGGGPGGIFGFGKSKARYYLPFLSQYLFLVCLTRKLTSKSNLRTLLVWMKRKKKLWNL